MLKALLLHPENYLSYPIYICIAIPSTPASASSLTTSSAYQDKRDVFRATEPPTARPMGVGDTEEVRPRPRRASRRDALGASPLPQGSGPGRVLLGDGLGP